MKKIHVIICFLLIAGYTLHAQNTETAVINAMNSGNSGELSKYFNTNIDLFVTGNEDVYSRTQAALILKNFFNAHPVTGFSVLHKGENPEAKYVIGKLSTGNGEFRVSIFLKMQDGKLLMNKLRIENT